jgi:hypothetical protein
MDHESLITSRSVTAERLGRRFNQAALLLLLFAVPALSTLAKTSWYLPQTDARHCLNSSVKIILAHSQFVFSGVLLQSAVSIVPPLPEIRRTSRQAQPEPSVHPIALIVSPLRRPPPAPVA